MTDTDHHPGSGRLTRVTLIGQQRHVDLVLPATEPLGVLLPEIVRILGVDPADDPFAYQLSLVDSRVLGPGTTLGSADVADGALVRVDRITESPAAMVVYDVSDAVSDDLGTRSGRWNDTARRWTARAASAVVATLAAVYSLRAAPSVDVLVLGLAVMVVSAAGAVSARWREVGRVVLGAGAGVAAVGATATASSTGLRLAAYTLLVMVALLVTGVLGSQVRAALIGAGTLVGLGVGWTVMLLGGVHTGRAAAVAGVASVFLLGLLPRVATLASGLTRLDDRRSAGDQVTAVAARTAVEAAHRGLAAATVAVAASTALAGYLAATEPGGWTLTLAVLLAVVVLLRLRAFPLQVEVLALIAASLTISAAVVVAQLRDRPEMWWVAPLVASLVVALSVVLVSVTPAVHTRARARQIGDRVEGLIVVALVPVVVGVFEVYPRLLAVFS